MRMPDGRVSYVDGMVWSAGNDVQNDWRCLRDWNAAVYPRYCGTLLWRHQWTVTPSLYRTQLVCHIELVQVGI